MTGRRGPAAAPAAAARPAPRARARDDHFADRVAVVTGAGGGIGRAVAAGLAARGVRALGLVDCGEGVRGVADRVGGRPGAPAALALVGDVTDAAFRRDAFDRLEARYGVPSLCVPAAGITRDRLAVRIDRGTGRAEIYPEETFRRVLAVDLLAPIYWALETVARVAEDRRRRGLGRWDPSEGVRGAVVFLGSVSSQGIPGQVAYSSAKAGLEGAAATLTKEAMYHGVRTAVIHPGFTDTPLVRALGEEFIRENVLPYTQLRRLIRPEEIADAVCFLIGNPAVSGELWADAGWHPSA